MNLKLAPELVGTHVSAHSERKGGAGESLDVAPELLRISPKVRSFGEDAPGQGIVCDTSLCTRVDTFSRLELLHQTKGLP